MTVRLAAFALVGALAASSAVAQTTPREHCANGVGPAPNQQSGAPETSGSASSGDTLSDKLARSDGVICPPSGMDPEIHAPTPEGGRTPVIPPPGSPGGDPTVRPK